MVLVPLRRAAAAALATLAFGATNALAVGIQALQVPARDGAPALAGIVWSPCNAPPSTVQLGPFALQGTMNCPIAGSGLPLVVISHGRTGSALGHHDTAEALAEAGFVVAAISHPGDNAMDPSLSDDLTPFVERPEDIRRLIDHLTGAWGSSSAIDPQRIGFFGFSRGGYTGLVLLGAMPGLDAAKALCAHSRSKACEDLRQGRLPPLAHDPRIKAAVLADPLVIFFQQDAFANVRVPIQLWRSELGGDGVLPGDIDRVAAALPLRPDYRTVPKAQHFSFLAPCPPALAADLAALCTDAPGFDRAAFHRELDDAAVAFFRRTLPSR